MRNILPLLLLVMATVGWFTLSSPAQPTAKAPVPDKAAQDKAMKLILDVFGEDLADAKDSDKKIKLANKLFQEGREVKDDATVRFVCFREARDLAAKANETGLALAIVEDIDRLYAVDALLMKADVLGLAVANATDKETGLALVEIIRPLLNEAIDLDHYKAAHQLGDAVVSAAKKAKSPSLVLELQRRVDEISTIEKGFAKIKGYLDRVEKNPKDAVANFELGSYFAYQKKRWEKALPYFARSDDKTIKTLAEHDLEGPKDVKDQLALADGWWDLAGTQKGGAKLALQMRAMHWYEKSLPATAGLNRTKAQKRIDLVLEQVAGSTTTVTPIAGPVGELKKFDGHSDDVKAVSLSHDGKYVASGSRDNTIRIWDLQVKDAKELQIIRGHTKEVWSLAFHPNNRFLLSGSWDATARVWDFKAGTEVKRFKHTLDVNGLCLSRDGNRVLTGSDDKHVYLWDVNNGDEIRKYSGHSDFVFAVAFSPDGRYIASGGMDKTVRIFDLTSGQLVKTFDGHTDPVTNVAFTSDSRFVLSAGDSVIHVWDLTTGKEAPRRFEQQAGRVQAMAISPDGKRLITGGDDRTIKYWDVTSGKLLHTFAGHNDTIICVAFSHDGRRIASGSMDRTVRLWGLPIR